MDENLSQAQRFAELVHKLEADENEARFDAKLREVAKHKPVPENRKYRCDLVGGWPQQRWP